MRDSLSSVPCVCFESHIKEVRDVLVLFERNLVSRSYRFALLISDVWLANFSLVHYVQRVIKANLQCAFCFLRIAFSPLYTLFYWNWRGKSWWIPEEIRNTIIYKIRKEAKSKKQKALHCRLTLKEPTSSTKRTNADVSHSWWNFFLNFSEFLCNFITFYKIS